jgi:uncharacterized membrane protein
MMFLWLIPIGIVVYLLLAKPGKRIINLPKASEDPEDLLIKRFVNGEITEEEYKKMLKVIRD